MIHNEDTFVTIDIIMLEINFWKKFGKGRDKTILIISKTSVVPFPCPVLPIPIVKPSLITPDFVKVTKNIKYTNMTLTLEYGIMPFYDNIYIHTLQ